ncbi:hypothetical protein POM88_055052 [Heracleum sosnowskyi]|uniref:Replication protein A 70 kDa DNA-binding subunit B/D first OB fold domain-containing protein n=1 Tax=Heracleum sosnowskyi TaxID=360622 RepID=A0AAD8GLT4_9APIA|nr:hypothetical protein POM88_055052 [Heracleum sosnowskyi]
MEYGSLADLELTSKHDGKIKVRLARKWRESNRHSGTMNGVHLILIDEYHKRMHGWIKSSLLQNFDNQFVDGENYEICNFAVAPYTEKYKCFESDTQIVLTNVTVVTPLEEKYSFIPDNIFHFTNLKHFVDATEEDSNLLDIVGIVDDVKPMKYVTNTTDGDQYFMEFVVTDLIHQVKVFLWNELASSFQHAFNQAADEPVIIVISCCRMIRNNYNGVMTIKNMAATTFDMNVNCDRVHTLRTRFWEVHAIW